MHKKGPVRTSLSTLLKLAALACASLFPALPSFAFCPQPDPTLACEFLNSNAVFVGKVISARAVPPRRATDLDGWLYVLTVQELFRGPRKKTIELITEPGRPSFTINVAGQHLLFAHE